MTNVSKASNQIDLALDELLVGVAEGLTEAQRVLDAQRRDSDGRPRPYAYVIPALDFEIKATCTIETADSGTRMRWRPVALGQTGDVTSSVTSTIRGRVLATPLGAAEGPARIDLVISGARPSYVVTATVRRVTGEPAGGVPLSFDVWPPIPGVRFDALVGRTDARGTAAATLHVDPTVRRGTRIAGVVATDTIQQNFLLLVD